MSLLLLALFLHIYHLHKLYILMHLLLNKFLLHIWNKLILFLLPNIDLLDIVYMFLLLNQIYNLFYMMYIFLLF